MPSVKQMRDDLLAAIDVGRLSDRALSLQRLGLR